jgi:hypothetical protein
MNEDQQESETGAERSARGGGSFAARVFASMQPQEVHTASALCVLGAEGLLQPHLSRHGGPVDGRRFAARSDRLGTSAPLHNAAKGGRSVVGEEVVPTVDHGHSPAGTKGEDPRPQCASGRDGHQRLRSTPHQPLLCVAAKKGGKTRANMCGLLSSLSQAGRGLRHGESLLPLGAGQPGTTARLRRLPSPARRSARPRRDQGGRGGCRVRQRSQPRVGPRRIGDSVADPRPAWPTRPRRTHRPLSKTDETPSERKSLWATLASRNGQLHDQTSQRRRRQRPHLLAPLPSPAPQSPHSQHHNSQATHRFSTEQGRSTSGISARLIAACWSVLDNKLPNNWEASGPS